MLPELTSQHIVHYIKQCSICHLANLYNSWLCQGTMFQHLAYTCINLQVHKPDADEILAQAYVNKTLNCFTLP